MNLKKILQSHAKLTLHPVNYIGVIESSDHRTSVLFESDAEGFPPEVIATLLGHVIRTAWRAYNESAPQKVNLSDFMNFLYKVTYRHVQDGQIYLEDRETTKRKDKRTKRTKRKKR